MVVDSDGAGMMAVTTGSEKEQQRVVIGTDVQGNGVVLTLDKAGKESGRVPPMQDTPKMP
jgi:hypothetical protein